MVAGAGNGPDTKHLELLQSIIQRLSGYTLLIKGWAITVAAGLAGLCIKQANPMMLWIAIATVSAFAALDAYYLALEQRFRNLAGEAANRIVGGEPATYDLDPGKIGFGKVVLAACSASILGVYVPTVALLALLAVATPTDRADGPQGPIQIIQQPSE